MWLVAQRKPATIWCSQSVGSEQLVWMIPYLDSSEISKILIPNLDVCINMSRLMEHSRHGVLKSVWEERGRILQNVIYLSGMELSLYSWTHSWIWFPTHDSHQILIFSIPSWAIKGLMRPEPSKRIFFVVDVCRKEWNGFFFLVL